MSEIKNVIEFRNAVKDYGDFKLDSISFIVPEGSVCGFIGQNGAGKTTTIAMLLDIISRDSGEVMLFGEPVDGKHAYLREDVGVVFDEMGFHEFLTPRQINVILRNSYKNWSDETFFENLRKFSLPSNKKCGAFSRGMRMKLQIAAALSHNAKLLVMDEPTSGLDPIVRNEILQIFREFMTEDDHTIMLSSHITGDLEKIADEVVFIDGGRIVLAGNKDDILEKHALLKCSNDDAVKISDSFTVYKQEGAYGAEILVNDADACRRLYPGMVIEPATLEEIMINYVNRAKNGIA